MVNFVKIRKIPVSQFLSQDDCATLVLGLIMSHLDYANALLCNAPKTTVQSFQRIQNMCSKLVLKRSKYESSREALRDLHWLPIQARIEFKILSLMHQCPHGCGAEYLKDLLSTKKPTVRSLWNSAKTNTIMWYHLTNIKLLVIDHLAIVAHVSGTVCQLISRQCKSTLISNKNAKLSFSGNTSRTC